MAYSESTLLRVATALATLAAVNAHGYIVSWTVDGQSRPGFDPSWDPSAKQKDTAQRHYFEKERGFPVLTSKDTACGARSTENTDVSIETWSATAGNEVKVEWDQWPTAHEGPIMQYMAACPAAGCDGVDAATLPWFKISEDAFNGKQWASDTLNQTQATWTFTIPEQLAPGFYMIRHEIIAMHYANDPQVYPVCIQTEVKSSGTFVAKDTVTFPEAYFEQSISNDFQTFNVHTNDSGRDGFVPPGPAVMDFSTGGGGEVPAASSAAASPSADAPAAPPSADSPVASSAGGEVAAPSASGNSGSGSTDAPSQDAEPISAPTSQVEEAPAQSDAVPISTASSAAGSSVNEQPSATGVNGGQSSAAPIGSGRGGGRGRHSRRPREARSCMASASASAQ